MNFFLLLFILPILFVFPGCSSFTYLLDTGIGQWKLMNRAKPIDEILSNPETDEKTKKAILLVQDVKQFAVQELKLKATSNYNTYVKLDGDYASYVVTASHPILLQAKTWKFPIVGEIPYIGFFSPEKAKKFAATLENDPENWFEIEEKKYPPDINIRGAQAYSTLGWLPDPLYSSMIRDNERRIVDTVIHESVHATIFIGSNMDFNERLANFIGLEGSLLYLKNRYGSSHKVVQEAEASLAAEKIFSSFIDVITKEYKQDIEPLAKKNTQESFAKKKEFYNSLDKKYKDLHEKLKRQWPNLSPPVWKIDFPSWNNAVLLGYRTYNADFSVFYRLKENCNNDIQKLMHFLEKEYEKNKKIFSENPEQYIQKLSVAGTCVY